MGSAFFSGEPWNLVCHGKERGFMKKYKHLKPNRAQQVERASGKLADSFAERISASIHDNRHDRSAVPDPELARLNEMTFEERKVYINRLVRELQY
jgi:hypothetical protein